MILRVVTEKSGRGWYANCYQAEGGRCREPTANAGPKRSEPAAASGAIGKFFREMTPEDEWYSDHGLFPGSNVTVLIIEIEERGGGKFIGRCFEDGFRELRGYSGPRTTALAAAKRSMGSYFHVRHNKQKETADARA